MPSLRKHCFKWFSALLVLAALLNATQAQAPSEDLIGRLLLLGFIGQEAPLDRLARFKPAGFVFYASNIASTEAVRGLTKSLQEATDYPLLFATNLEGGVVNGYQTPEATAWPSFMAIAASGQPELASQVAQAAAEELGYAGFNVSFGPVLDVNLTIANPIIGIRSFGSDARVVSGFARAYLQGLEQAGIMAVAKHFPGHGATTQDSHFDLPLVLADRARLEQVELLPYQTMIAAGVPAIMTAHVVYPALDATAPATLSKPILSDLLRGELGFEGLVITDSMGMKAITDRYGAGEAAVLSILAGADLLLLHTDFETQEAVYQALQAALASGRLSEARLREATARSSRLAERYRPHWNDPEPDYAAHRKLAIDIAAKGATLLWNDGVLPLAQDSKVVVIAPRPKDLGPISDLGTVLEQYHLNVEKVVVREQPTIADIQAALEAAQQAEVIVLASYHWSEPFPESLIALQSTLAATGKPLVSVALGNPDDFRFFSQRPAAYLASYGPRNSSLEAASLILTGQAVPTGKLPMAIEDFAAGAGLTGF
jgi:beta-N-acetylhexosaminidase